MAEIVPTILCEDADDYKSTIEKMTPYATRVHIDLADGEFAPTRTVELRDMWWPQDWQVDIHAMVARPSLYVDALIQMRPSLVIFHSEVEENLAPTLQKLKAAEIKTGVALLRPTVPNSKKDYIEVADHVLIFSGDLGHYGGKASLMQLEKVRLIRNIHPEVEVGWDGGATFENVFSLAQGGVNIINCGSAIHGEADEAEAYQKLKQEINKQGVI